MFRNLSALKYTCNNSKYSEKFCRTALEQSRVPVVILLKTPVPLIHYPLRTFSIFNVDYNRLQKLLKKSRVLNYKKFNKNFSTSPYYRNEKKDDGNKPDDLKGMHKFLSVITSFVLVAILSSLFRNPEHPIPVVSWEEFKNEMLAKGEVDRIVINTDINRVYIHLHKGAIFKNQIQRVPLYSLSTSEVSKVEEKIREAERQLGIPVQDSVLVSYISKNYYLPIAVLIAILCLITLSKGGISMKTSFSDFMNISKAKFTLVDPLSGRGKGVKFSDVAGLQEAKIEVMEFVDYLKRPEYYRNLGARVPKGALLLGPPGCGKTLLAKAVATEASVPFLSMNGSEFIEMIGGLGAARVRDLFQEANKRIPCIVYIDEIDAIGKKRGGGNSTRGDTEGEQTLNQLLVEMDGMASKEGVVLLASTNRADVLDKALLRPGRFDRQILIDLPTFEERRQIFEKHLKSIHLENEPSYYSRRLAHLTPGFSGADIANVCNEAALHAARFKKTIVQGDDLEYAIERVVGGLEKKSSAMSPEETTMLAYHEAGRALVGWLSQYGDALLKITIVPRTQSPAGWTQFQERDKSLFSKEELLGKMSMGLGGKVAVSIMFNTQTTGGEKDLKMVTRIAYAQVMKFGMNSNVGLLSFDVEDSDTGTKKPYSKQFGALLDQEARRLIATAYKETETLLLKNKDKLVQLAGELLKRETLNYDDVVKILGPPPHAGKKLIEPFEFEMSLQQAAGPEPEPAPAPDSSSNKTPEP